jgi:hypothetical protein
MTTDHRPPALSLGAAELEFVRSISMRPGQLEPNEFEIELLKRFAAQDPA